MKASEISILAVAVLGAVFLLRKYGPNINPLSKENVFNTGLEAGYKALTGSNQSPMADLADKVYANANDYSMGILTNFFVEKGVTDENQQKMLDLGWSPADVDTATKNAESVYPTQLMYELPPLI